jgi:hypothetical protein
MPGALDLASARPFRGHLTLLGASLLPIAAAGHVAAASRSGVGPLTAIQTPGALRLFPLPEVSHWTILWNYRDAPLFWASVGVLAVAAGVLQATAVVRCRRQKDATPDESVETRTHPSGRPNAA